MPPSGRNRAQSGSVDGPGDLDADADLGRAGLDRGGPDCLVWDDGHDTGADDRDGALEGRGVEQRRAVARRSPIDGRGTGAASFSGATGSIASPPSLAVAGDSSRHPASPTTGMGTPAIAAAARISPLLSEGPCRSGRKCPSSRFAAPSGPTHATVAARHRAGSVGCTIVGEPAPEQVMREP